VHGYFVFYCCGLIVSSLPVNVAETTRNVLIYHHQMPRSKSIAVSTMRRQQGRSVARRNAKWSPS